MPHTRCSRVSDVFSSSFKSTFSRSSSWLRFFRSFVPCSFSTRGMGKRRLNFTKPTKIDNAGISAWLFLLHPGKAPLKLCRCSGSLQCNPVLKTSARQLLSRTKPAKSKKEVCLTLQKHLQQNFFKKNCWLKVAKLVRGLQKLSNKGGKITFDNLFVLTHGAENLCRCAVCPH